MSFQLNPPPSVKAQLDALRAHPHRPAKTRQDASLMASSACIVGLAMTSWNRRHLLPVARAGGWPVLTALQGLGNALVVVASHGDEQAAVRNGARHTVLMEHGAGLSYVDDSLPMNGAWGGGRGLGPQRRLLLSPGPELAARHQAAHPHIPVAVVGSPMLDEYTGIVWKPEARPRVCISSHWDCQQLPETRSSWSWVKDRLPELAKDERWELCGHWHPLENRNGLAKEKRAFYEQHGIRVMSTFETVLEEADLFITDNSSTLYEFAATGRPVVALNPPCYRRDVKHGMRFWSHIPGLQVNNLSLLADTIADALQDGKKAKALRNKAVKYCYGKLDGKASERAAAAVRECFMALLKAGSLETTNAQQ